MRIVVAKGASLRIAGKRHESDSGITCNSTIMVQRRLIIGSDLICAWNVFITDSDWHGIVGQSPQSDVEIGNHVWIAHGSSILKGARLGDGVVVASHSLVKGAEIPPYTLVAGVPAEVVRSNLKWQRDLPV